MTPIKSLAWCSALLSSVLGWGIQAQAAAVSYPLDYIFSPAPAPGASYGQVTLDDLGQAIRFHVANQAGEGSKLDALYFNFNGNPSLLSFSNVNVNGVPLASSAYETVLAPSGSATLSSLKADGDGYYDGKIQYKSGNFLGFGHTLAFDLGITGQDLSPSDFLIHSLPGGGSQTYVFGAHIQNLPPEGGSLWVGSLNPVPLPASVMLFGTGLAWLGGLARRKRSYCERLMARRGGITPAGSRLRLTRALLACGCAVLLGGMVPELSLASPVQVVGRDANGDLLLKSGELVTPSGLPRGVSLTAGRALAGQGVGPIFANVIFSGYRPVPVVVPPAPPRSAPPLVEDSLVVPEPPPMGFGLTYGGIAFGPGVAGGPPQGGGAHNQTVTGRITLSGTVSNGTVSSGAVISKFTLDGTVTTVQGTLVPNPLPDAVGLFLTGLGVLALIGWRSHCRRPV